MKGGFVKSSCRDEVSIVHGLFKKTTILASAKQMLTSILNKLLALGVDPHECLADDLHEMGNLGFLHPEESLQHLMGPDSTLREKIHAITNCLFDSKLNKPKGSTGVKLLHYIFRTHTPFAVERKKFILKLFNNKFSDTIFSEKYGFLWSPITIKYPEFVFKRINLAQVKWNRTIVCKLKESELLEPLSEYERSFLGTSIKPFLPYITGECYYRSNLISDPISKTRVEKKICTIAGLSGHSMFLLELTQLLGLDWKLMVYCLLIAFVPHHHSISEIFDAVYVLGLLNKRQSVSRACKSLVASLSSFSTTRKKHLHVSKKTRKYR